MRQLSFPGRSNVLAQNGMIATSNPLSSIEALNILNEFENNEAKKSLKLLLDYVIYRKK